MSLLEAIVQLCIKLSPVVVEFSCWNLLEYPQQGLARKLSDQAMMRPRTHNLRGNSNEQQGAI